jgi:hypothetical protein
VSNESCRATIGISSGTAYWEVVVTGGWDAVVGVETLSSSSLLSWVGSDASGWGIYTADGNIFNNGSPVAYANPVPAGTVIGFGLDMSAGTLRIWLNGVDKGIAFSGLTGTIYPATTGFGTGITANFGATPFVYSHDGYKAGVY